MSVKIKSIGMFLSKHPYILACLFFTIVTAVLYSNILEAPFMFDTHGHINENPYIQVDSLTIQNLIDAAIKSPAHKRPLANITLALNFRLGGLDVTGYHLVNIVIHIINGTLLFFFIRITLLLSSQPKTLNSKSGTRNSKLETAIPHAELLAFAATLIWLVHPLCTQSVTYVIQRMNSMAALFYLLSMVLYIKGRMTEESVKKYLLFGMCVVSGLCALGSKQIAATLPFFIFLYEWYFFQDLDRVWLKKRLPFILFILIFLFAAAVVYLGVNPLDKILAGYRSRDFTLPQRVMTEFRIVIMYMTLLLFPHPSRLNLDYDFPLSYSLIDPPTTLISLGIIAGLIIPAILFAKKERLLSFCIVWFFGNLALESSVIGLELVYEHRTYLPSMLVSLLCTVLAYRYIKVSWMRIVLLCVTVLLFSFWTYERNAVWGDELTFLRDCVSKSPEKARPNNNLGLVMVRLGMIDEAIVHYEKALESKPDFVDAHVNIGTALSKKGMIDEAVQHYNEAIRIKPRFFQAYINLGVILAKRGKTDEAIAHYEKALEIYPDSIEAHQNLGNALLKQGNIDEAMVHYGEAIRLWPNNYVSHNSYGTVLALKGRLDEAVEHYETSLRINPDYAEAHKNLADVFFLQNRLHDAIMHYQDAVRIDPGHEEARKRLQAALTKKQKIDEAKEQLSHLIADDPGNISLHNKFGDLLRNEGDFNGAIARYEKVLSLDPRSLRTLNNLAIAHTAKGEYDRAFEILLRVTEVDPDNSGGYYNIACLFSRQRRVDESLAWLKKAVDRGFDNCKLLRTDSDLVNIRATSYYINLTNSLCE